MPVHSAFLKYFDEVRRRGSIRLAARKLYVASSAVNRQILKVEDELGIALFERLPNGIRPTPAGELLAAHIERTLADAERTLAEIAALKNSKRARITIAGQESVIAHFLPPALVELHAAQADISTVFKAASGLQLRDLLLAGEIDIALAFDPDSDPKIRLFAQVELPVGAVVTPRHPLAGRASVSLADCVHYPIVLPDQTWPLRALLDREIENSGLRPNVITSSNSVEFLKCMVDHHLGVGFQTIVGIEAKVDKRELLHIPLCNPGPVQQCFAVCVCHTRIELPAVRAVLPLLARRLDDYR